jgi:hypothetical protein
MNVIGPGNLLAGVVILLIGGAVVVALFWVFVRFEDVRLSRPDGAVQIRVRSLGGKSQTEIPPASVQGATIERNTAKTRSSGSGRRGGKSSTTTTYRPALMLAEKGAGNRPLMAAYSSRAAPAEAAVKAINTWLAQRPS